MVKRSTRRSSGRPPPFPAGALHAVRRRARRGAASQLGRAAGGAGAAPALQGGADRGHAICPDLGCGRGPSARPLSLLGEAEEGRGGGGGDEEAGEEEAGEEEAGGGGDGEADEGEEAQGSVEGAGGARADRGGPSS